MSDRFSNTLRTPLCDLLGCEVPVLLAGMGGVSRWELAAAVAEAGGYAMLGMVREDPTLIEAEVKALQSATRRRFAVNLIPAATDPALLDRQISLCLDLGVTDFTFFWDVMPKVVHRVKQQGCLVLHQVGTPEAARQAQGAGADVLIAQGIEAGGHVHGRIGTLALVEEIAAQSDLPVVASGGISTGAGLVAALALGAQGVQLGTAFLATTESFAHDYHKKRVISAVAGDTVLTDIYVLNWPAHAAVRVIANSVTESLGFATLGHDPEKLPRQVIAHEAARPIYRYSTDSPLRITTGDLEAMALFAGQGVSALTDIVPAGVRLARIVADAEACLARLLAIAAPKVRPAQ